MEKITSILEFHKKLKEIVAVKDPTILYYSVSSECVFNNGDTDVFYSLYLSPHVVTRASSPEEAFAELERQMAGEPEPGPEDFGIDNQKPDDESPL